MINVKFGMPGRKTGHTKALGRCLLNRKIMRRILEWK
jgi:hypothetical protein